MSELKTLKGVKAVFLDGGGLELLPLNGEGEPHSLTLHGFVDLSPYGVLTNYFQVIPHNLVIVEPFGSRMQVIGSGMHAETAAVPDFKPAHEATEQKRLKIMLETIVKQQRRKEAQAIKQRERDLKKQEKQASKIEKASTKEASVDVETTLVEPVDSAEGGNE